jgi:hypothetical protein
MSAALFHEELRKNNEIFHRLGGKKLKKNRTGG